MYDNIDEDQRGWYVDINKPSHRWRHRSTSNNQNQKNMAFPNQQSNYPSNVQTDRFGTYQLKTALEVVDKKTGQIVSGHFKVYFELGGKLYKFEISARKKEHKSGRDGLWVKATLPNRSNPAATQRARM